jgi:hypothetical protein
MGMNATSLDGVQVLELEEYLKKLGGIDEIRYGGAANSTSADGLQVGDDFAKDTEILIATPENVMPEIEELLEAAGLHNYTRLTSDKWAELMRSANEITGEFPPLDSLSTGKVRTDIEFFMAKFYKDKPLNSDYKIPSWITPIQVGAALTSERVAEIVDSDGDNISLKNVNYSELTALYWLWKHKLESQNTDTLTGGINDSSKYYGLVHYRRILEVSDKDLLRLSGNDIDVVLPYPMPYLPDIHAHHERYLKPVDWEALLTALRELQPEYAEKLPEIFSQQYLYNYNIMLAKKTVLRDYCRWLFPILQRTEELSEPKGWERADRYIGYMGENLTTLYFMANKDKLRIVHKGCRFLV